MSTLNDLAKLPGSSHIYGYADWAELLCYVSSEQCLTVNDLVTALSGRKGDKATDGDGLDADPILPPSPPASGGESDDPERIDLQDGSDAAQVADRHYLRAEEIFSYIAARCVAFGDAYPFAL